MSDEKRLAVVLGNNELADIVVKPGTEARDILAQLNLPKDFMLSRSDGKPFAGRESIWPAVEDGDKIFSSPPATVA